uniref:Uncharacterized protein n=1 Tax=mine drainage metagenome TaxID=410659 RepID=E6PXY9_9ZZZZ
MPTCSAQGVNINVSRFQRAVDRAKGKYYRSSQASSELCVGFTGDSRREHRFLTPPQLLCNRSLSHRNVTVRSLYKLSPFGYSFDV